MASTVTKVCEYCEKPFEVERRRADRARFCCREHKDLAGRSSDWGECEVCGVPVPPGKKYCSPEHYNLRRTGRSRGPYRNAGKLRAEWWFGTCSGPDCHNLIARRVSEMSEVNYCSRGCFLRTRTNSPGNGRPNVPIGTRSIDGDGYVRIKIGTGHNGWRLEHMVVMEQHLGRPLLPEENVHHKFGDRSDNRIERLELWNTSQPKGQRVEDKITFAMEMLKLYRPEFLVPCDWPQTIGEAAGDGLERHLLGCPWPEKHGSST